MRLAVYLLCAIGLTGCQPSLLNYESQVHVVRPGETLYTIAWRYGVDYRSLARWNNIDNPDMIFAGQRVSLRPGDTVQRPVPGSASPRTPPASSAPPLPTAPAPAWQWPTNGRVVARFASGDGIDSGIAIEGASGQLIMAAAGGRVVYSGSGLIGYGQLVIIKHNDTYLSAYGHMEDVLVVQGDEVRQGQPIAAMGFGPERQPQLHFEIRRNGAPIDPVTMLPRS